MSQSRPVRVLFVCMGNICRSPTAEGVFRHILQQQGLDDLIETDSCGTHAYHIGEEPDNRSQMHAHRRGIDLSDLRARQFRTDDWHEFDYILAMDLQNHQILDRSRPGGSVRGELTMMLSHATNTREEEVPDPYYGGDQGFEQVLDMLEDACQGLLTTIQATRTA